MEIDKEIRCERCRRLLAKGEVLRLAIKCPRCRTINHVTRSGSTLEKTAKP